MKKKQDEHSVDAVRRLSLRGIRMMMMKAVGLGESERNAMTRFLEGVVPHWDAATQEERLRKTPISEIRQAGLTSLDNMLTSLAINSTYREPGESEQAWVHRYAMERVRMHAHLAVRGDDSLLSFMNTAIIVHFRGITIPIADVLNACAALVVAYSLSFDAEIRDQKIEEFCQLVREQYEKRKMK